MTPEQVTEIMSDIDRVGTLVTVVLIIEVVIAAALTYAHVRITRNEVELAELVRKAVAQIQSDLPKK